MEISTIALRATPRLLVVVLVFLTTTILWSSPCLAWTTAKSTRPSSLQSSTALPAASLGTWFPAFASSTSLTDDQLKAQILQLGATLDRGQAYNPTSGSYYEENMDMARYKIQQLCELRRIPSSIREMEGEWELVLSTVPHGIFRSSPFFLAIQEAYEYALNGEGKANLFFKLHELQTCSWGTSKIGRVAQRIAPRTGLPGLGTEYYLYSEFDTSIFSLTVIPILGWFKLLPTFGGCVVTAAACELVTFADSFGRLEAARLDMEVDYTTSRKVPGLSGLPLIGDVIWKLNVPVGKIWKWLPWNKGRPATCKVFVTYLDDDFRIVQDIDGEYFVYTRPVVSRDLDYA